MRLVRVLFMRIGIGYDIHRFGEKRDLIIGGVKIEHDEGLIAHSDGDLLLHAIMDALLGAAGLGDIGTHFPDTDPKYKDAKSNELLKNVIREIEEDGWKVENIDCNIIAQRPRLSAYQTRIKESVAKILKIDEKCVNIKIRSNEKLDAIGRGEAIAVQVVTLIENEERSKRQKA